MNYRLLSIVCLALTFAVFAETVPVDTVVVADTSVTSAVTVDNEKEADTLAATAEAVVAGETVVADTSESAVAADTTVRRVLDLDRLLSEDDEEDDLLAEEKPAVAKPDAADSTVVDSAGVTQDSERAAAPIADSTQTESVQTETPHDEQPIVRGRRGEPPPIEPVDKGPAVIVDGKTINFAQNLEAYRSPRVAMLMSLIVPGLGQAYSRNYLKAAAFGAVELAGIVTAAALNSVGKSKKRDAHRFADANFSVDRLKGYGDWMKDEFNKISEIDTGRIPTTLPYELYDDYFFESQKNGGSYFYNIIGDAPFTPGWIDSDPYMPESQVDDNGYIIGRDGMYELAFPGVESAFYLITRVSSVTVNERQHAYAYSGLQTEYNSMIDDANSYHDAVNYVLYALIINHIASAIDAGFTARAYNARLLGQGGSVWERISVNQQYVFTGSDVSPGIALRYKF